MNDQRVNKMKKMWQSVYRTMEEETDGTIDRRIGGFITGGKLRGDLITGTPGDGTGEHAANHHKDGSDPISLDLLATVENDTDLVLKPDGNGGVQWVTPPSGNGNGGGITPEDVIVYANEPPQSPTVGLVYIDSTGQGINPDGSRS